MKLALIGVLVLVMLIPTTMVSGVIAERQARQAEVENQFARSWGPRQAVLGPLLVVPYRVPSTLRDKPDGRGFVFLAPSAMRVAATVQPEVRKRGFFSAVVYTARTDLAGTFEVPDLSVPDTPSAELLWTEAAVILGASDLRLMRSDTRLGWDNRSVPFGAPSSGSGSCGGLSFASAPLGLGGAPARGQAIPFQVAFDLRGVRGLRVVPTAAHLQLEAKGNWPAPSFVGPALPLRSDVGDGAFSAEWDLSNTTNAQQSWASTQAFDCRDGGVAVYSEEEQVGVELLDPQPTYRMVDRASKYTMLFMVLCFLTYFLFEAFMRVRIGLLAYGLIGLSVSLFALLLVSFGEPLGFAPAYAISAVLVGVQGTLYTAAVTRRIGLAAIFAAVQASLFGFLYVVLNMDTYALLTGSITLFLILSVLMAATRRAGPTPQPADGAA